MKDTQFSDLLGKTLAKVDVGYEEVVFTTKDGEAYKLFHDQNCCESVAVEDVCGSVNDLIDSPLLMAEEITSSENPLDAQKEYQDSFTWTFYKLATVKGYVTIRWYGESNGYYSETVSFAKVA